MKTGQNLNFPIHPQGCKLQVVVFFLNSVCPPPTDAAALTSALWLVCVGSCFTVIASGEKLTETQDTDQLIYRSRLSPTQTVRLRLQSRAVWRHIWRWKVHWQDRCDRNRRDCCFCANVCSPPWVSFSSWLVSHNGPSSWANRVQSYQTVRSTFT